MKKTILSAVAFVLACSGAVAQSQNDGLPGTPQTEAYVVTPVDTTSGVTVRKVSFLRSNNIVLVGNLFLLKGFDKTQKISRHPQHPSCRKRQGAVRRTVCLPLGGERFRDPRF